MCASYGLGGGGRIVLLPDGLEPTSETESSTALREWVEQYGGHAKITGKNARNLNPVVHELDGERGLEFAWWWLWLSGEGPAKFSAFNSRDDSLVKRWRGPFQRRAILPASWYDEGGKRWGLPGGEAFGIAAITSTVERADNGARQLTYSMVTRHGVGEASTVVSKRGESRMPLVLPADLYDEWLDPERPGDAEFVAQVQHASEEISRAMTAA